MWRNQIYLGRRVFSRKYVVITTGAITFSQIHKGRLNIQKRKIDTSLFSLRNIKILPNAYEKEKSNFSADSLDCRPISDDLEINP